MGSGEGLLPSPLGQFCAKESTFEDSRGISLDRWGSVARFVLLESGTYLVQSSVRVRDVSERVREQRSVLVLEHDEILVVPKVGRRQRSSNVA